MINDKLNKAKRLINKGAKLWEIGNNSGNNEILHQKELESKKAYERAEVLIKEVYPTIEIDYPGLYPSFKLDGYNFYSLESLEHYNG